MFTDDGELKVGRENVVDVEELLPVEPVVDPPSAVDDAANVMSQYEEVEDLPPDDEIDEVLDPDDGHGIEDINDPTDKVRRGWIESQRKRKKT